jgi:peptidyl-tRNA hydrolase, PTH1 family
MPDNTLWMIVGLGNPGRRYEQTRHNIGFLIIDRLAERYGIFLTRKKFENLYGKGEIEGVSVLLSKPMAYMNRSGFPVYRLAMHYGIGFNHLLVIHDDVDIDLGILKIKVKGGHGGHNGLKSIIDAVNGGEFPRIRIGIGRPPAHVDDATEHVLGRFSAEEKKALKPVLQRAEDAVTTIIRKGITKGMNQFNQTVQTG